MGADKLQLFLNQHCRFILRSGKEVFGVIWKVQSQGNTDEYYFSSISDHERYLKIQDPEVIDNKMTLNLDDVILAERLVG